MTASLCSNNKKSKNIKYQRTRVCFFPRSLNHESRLTVSTSVYFQSESNPPSGVPVERDQAKKARYHRLLQFVLDHGVSITVTWKCLQQQKYMLARFISDIRLLVAAAKEDEVLAGTLMETQLGVTQTETYCAVCTLP